MNPSDVSEAAARALINQRCAAAYLHDVRGGMQALFSALDLLSRAAKVPLGNATRIEKACDLAQRAIAHHDKSTIQILEVLTLQNSEPATLDLGTLVHEAVHFLRNDASNKSLVLKFVGKGEMSIHVDRNRFQAMLAGLLTTAIDQSTPGRELTVDLTEVEGHAMVTLNSDAGYSAETIDSTQQLISSFARNFLASCGGSLEVDRGSLKIYYPLVTHAHLPHRAYRLEQSNTPTGDDL